MSTITHFSTIAANEGKNLAPHLMAILATATAGAAYLSKKERRKALRKAKWQVLKSFLFKSKGKIKIGKGLRIFLVLGLLATTILGVTIWPLWVGGLSFLALLFVLLAMVNI